VLPPRRILGTSAGCLPIVHVNAQPRTRNRTESRNTGSQGRRAKTLSRALDADSEAAPVRRAAGERGRRSIAARGERLHHLRLIRTLHPRARACSVRAREDGLAGWCGRSSYGSNRSRGSNSGRSSGSSSSSRRRRRAVAQHLERMPTMSSEARNISSLPIVGPINCILNISNNTSVAGRKW